MNYSELRSQRYRRIKDRTPVPLSPPKSPDWQQLVEPHMPVAFREARLFARRLREQPDDWEGVALEALVRAARRYDDGYRTPEGEPVRFDSYAKRAIQNALLKHRNRAQSQPPLADPEALSDVPSTDRHSDTEHSTDVATLLACPLLLERERTALVLHYLEGQTVNAVAERLGVYRQTASLYIRSGLEVIRLAERVNAQLRRPIAYPSSSTLKHI